MNHHQFRFLMALIILSASLPVSAVDQTVKAPVMVVGSISYQPILQQNITAGAVHQVTYITAVLPSVSLIIAPPSSTKTSKKTPQKNSIERELVADKMNKARQVIVTVLNKVKTGQLGGALNASEFWRRAFKYEKSSKLYDAYGKAILDKMFDSLGQDSTITSKNFAMKALKALPPASSATSSEVGRIADNILHAHNIIVKELIRINVRGAVDAQAGPINTEEYWQNVFDEAGQSELFRYGYEDLQTVIEAGFKGYDNGSSFSASALNALHVSASDQQRLRKQYNQYLNGH